MGRIDCKTAGQMVVHLQTLSKLLWQIHRKERKGRKDLPLIHADNTDLKRLPNLKPLPRIHADERVNLKTKTLPLINTDDTDLKKLPKAELLPPFELMGVQRWMPESHSPPESKAA